MVHSLIERFYMFSLLFFRYDGESNLSTVEVYDPAQDSWTFVSSMKWHGGGVGAAVLPN